MDFMRMFKFRKKNSKEFGMLEAVGKIILSENAHKMGKCTS